MLLGAIASSITEPAGSALTALGMLDFVAGTYEYNNTSYTAAQTVDQTGWITANGLEVPASQAAGAQILISALTTRLATSQWTIVIETEIISNTGQSLLFTEANSGNAFYIYIVYFGAADWDLLCNDGVNVVNPYDPTNGISTGIHKIAATRIDNKAAISIDGNAIVGTGTDLTACTLPVIGFPMANYFLGGWSDNTQEAVRIRRFSVYDPVPDASLPALSI